MRRISTLCLAVTAAAAAAACADPPTRAIGPEVLTVSLAKGGGGSNVHAHLSGDEEVPSRVTPAQGQLQLKINAAQTEVEYKLEVANIDNVIMAHIHVAPAGANGPIAVWLTPGPPPFPSGGGPFQGRLADGTFTAANLVGPMAGKSIADFVAAIKAGKTYVNVHTNDGVGAPNSGPGDFPGGELRAQLVRGNLFHD